MNELDEDYVKNLYKWNKPNKHLSKLNTKIKESENIRNLSF